MILKHIMQKDVDVITDYSACTDINNNMHESVTKQHIRFTRACSNVSDFNNRNKFLTAKLLKKGY